MSLAFESLGRDYYTRLGEQLAEFRRILGSVLIQDMRSRYGYSHIGYLIAIAWPLSHIGVIMFVHLLRTSIAPVGDSPATFVGTGVVP